MQKFIDGHDWQVDVTDWWMWMTDGCDWRMGMTDWQMWLTDGQDWPMDDLSDNEY